MCDKVDFRKEPLYCCDLVYIQLIYMYSTGCKKFPYKGPRTRFGARNCISEPGPQEPYRGISFETTYMVSNTSAHEAMPNSTQWHAHMCNFERPIPGHKINSTTDGQRTVNRVHKPLEWILIDEIIETKNLKQFFVFVFHSSHFSDGLWVCPSRPSVTPSNYMPIQRRYLISPLTPFRYRR
jgi:hypothetical protein